MFLKVFFARYKTGLTKTLLIMKFTAIILLSTCLAASAKGHSQNVSLTLKDAPLEKAFAEIKQQTGYGFVYKADLLEHTSPVSVSVKSITLQQALDLCFKNQPLTYKIFRGFIVVKSKDDRVDLEDISLPPPPIDVHGRIVNENGEPLAGVSIKIKGTNTGTTTNANGEFTLTGVDDNATLVFSGTNIEAFEKKLNGKNDLGTLSAVTKVNALEEVTVNKGYYSEKKDLTTGDVTTISSKEISRQPVSNVLAAIQGRVPGMVIAQKTGVPGGSFSVMIRGANSLANGNDPLYVIDGIPYPSQVISTISSNLSGGNPLNFINPSDIEKIDILKDADATSIYGSRAANGAVLITTKKGKTDGMNIHFNMYSGIGHVVNFASLLNSQEYLKLRHEAFANDNMTPGTTDYDLNGKWDTTRYTDWQKTLFGNNAHYYDAQASVSGGNANVQYLIGGGYHRETSVYPTGNGTGPDTKASLHLSLTSKSQNQRFTTQFLGSYVSDVNQLAPNDFTSTALTLPPVAPSLYNSDGSLNWAAPSPGQYGSWSNPLGPLQNSYKGNTGNLFANSILSYKILSNLELKTSFGYIRTQTNELIRYPLTSRDPASITSTASGSSQFNNTIGQTWNIEPQLNYTATIGKGNLSALVGATWLKTTKDGQSFSATGFPADAFLANIKAASSVTVQSVVNSVYKYNALFGRLNYNWEDKYIANLSVRRDGSSRFGPGNQFSNFGSAGVAWIFSKEKWISHKNSFLSFGKIRLSYGSSGNDQIPDYKFLDLYNNTQYPYQGSQGIYPAGLFNSELAWELNKKFEAGLNMRFFKDRLSFELNYYKNKSNNQLLSIPLSYTTGFTGITANLPATILNSGIEVLLQSFNVESKNISWITSVNLTVPQNKLASFDNFVKYGYSTGGFVIGQPIQGQRVFDLVGIDPTTGLYQYKTANGTLSSDYLYQEDKIAFMKLLPKFYGGFSNDIRWKSFDLNIFFQFVKQMGRTLESYLGPAGFKFNTTSYYYSNRWQKPGDNALFQKVTQTYAGAYFAFQNIANGASNFSYEDASYVRLKNVSLSWQLPSKFQDRLHLNNCRIYFEGQNLLTFTKYHGLDPETQSNALPPLKVFAFGVEFNLK